MSLERFRRTRMVVLNQRSVAYQPARAMADNRIGAVLVAGPPGIVGILTDRNLALVALGGDRGPKTTPLDEVMSEEVITCDIGAGIDDVVRLMRDNGIRRVPLTEAGRPVGLVTFDDLVVDGSVGLDALHDIVTAQLEVEAPQKPAGVLHPRVAASAQGRARALMRAKARAEATYNRMVAAVAAGDGVELGRCVRACLQAL
jgi:signal-transduction protein with cAMP-binding, CBS, and nucleotidyltransferase domain